ncbi:hypothetical protein [Derxia lacustris]|uniref:hypothetical protein n=1 Tax=Derxia lacustris TaxID=764842 RepID=UPI00111C5C9E|nr:hypothetical protein [Derxia lacustris]
MKSDSSKRRSSPVAMALALWLAAQAGSGAALAAGTPAAASKPAPGMFAPTPDNPLQHPAARNAGSGPAPVTLAPGAPASLAGAPDLAPLRAQAARIAAELAERCPLAAPSDAAALDACRQAMFHGSALRNALAADIAWGRDGKFPTSPLAATGLTRFSPDALAGMYLPLFMFNGRWSVDYVPEEGRARLRLEAAFRNRLAPGEFPYPFWHDPAKWSAYENTHAIVLWWAPDGASFDVGQFSWRGPLAAGAHIDPLPTPAFDGRWMWTDAQGRMQPKVTLFDGLYSAGNPYKKRVDASYRSFALALRKGDCVSCHSPDNASGMQRLVLLQTPMHAATEIDAVLDSIRRERMPIDTYGSEIALDAATRRLLLDRGAKFAAEVKAARDWEAARDGAARPAARTAQLR